MIEKIVYNAIVYRKSYGKSYLITVIYCFILLEQIVGLCTEEYRLYYYHLYSQKTYQNAQYTLAA